MKNSALIIVLLICASMLHAEDQKWNGWTYHTVETDADGGILPWYDADHLGRSYDHVLDLVWNYWISLPTNAQWLQLLRAIQDRQRPGQ